MALPGGRGACAGAVQPGHRVLVHPRTPPGVAVRPCPPCWWRCLWHTSGASCAPSRRRGSCQGRVQTEQAARVRALSQLPRGLDVPGRATRCPGDSADPTRSRARGGDPQHRDHGAAPGHLASPCTASGGRCVVGALTHHAQPVPLHGEDGDGCCPGGDGALQHCSQPR